MKRETLRYVLILAIISVTGIISIQIYWFSRAFDIRDKQFDQTVNIALRSVADQIFTYNGSPIPLDNPVEQLTSNYFVVMVNDDIDANFLETLLTNEFKSRDLVVVFDYGIFNCVDEKMVFGNSISLDEGKKPKKTEINLPVWEDNDYYFGVMFPNKKGRLLGQMSIWIFSSVVLLIVTSFFAYAILVVIFDDGQQSQQVIDVAIGHIAGQEHHICIVDILFQITQEFSFVVNIWQGNERGHTGSPFESQHFSVVNIWQRNESRHRCTHRYEKSNFIWLF